MPYITDRKRASGLGSAKRGTEKHWQMSLSSAALVVLVVLFIFTFGGALGMGYEEAVVYYHRPFPAIVALLTIAVGLLHFRGGVQILIDDYTRGLTRKALIVGTACLSYAALAAGVFAIARLAL
ncbi:succinate dehydrogenase, hydrophobic membrane anchor protein [Oceanicola granulosus HTCC2516]|uniref:Succinate dehydrogenase, hydrophobic membrane anchor protein n=1 Tax=Oceanicola granulosus (strain ATCC BAA-861 / DSM 15982 / KCTC 12143 / HTCC2516) TaxID=314256 RepID=Q2CI40_OCEGH|nr:succinate dehydrogenase, hydrophobic membrane anchor protein [Oceanicola granulosus]EAR52418.1 succinate dehydrogenase, hydrophobic membrane anchor protein [Oceanicola granulosus HTCC2516]